MLKKIGRVLRLGPKHSMKTVRDMHHDLEGFVDSHPNLGDLMLKISDGNILDGLQLALLLHRDFIRGRSSTDPPSDFFPWLGAARFYGMLEDIDAVYDLRGLSENTNPLDPASNYLPNFEGVAKKKHYLPSEYEGRQVHIDFS